MPNRKAKRYRAKSSPNIDNLPAPHGDCAMKELRQTTYYTTEECYLDCLTKYGQNTCGCRDTYWPYFNGIVFANATYVVADEFDRSIRERCKCPIPCHFFTFDPSSSYSSISNHLVAKLLTSKEVLGLEVKLLNAYGTSAKMDDEKSLQFESLVNEFQSKTNVIDDIIMKIYLNLEKQKNKTKEIFTSMEDAY
ncbi:hypothetical protein MAR_001383 [Mya arenaria]|uniref:DZIP3-like HEPN domain-containing protein n=1 Tax=Mya arenaria TaxID=6604 RepID=A0ABY7FBR3_MYAAR|nr:hypothetical protein MAR_001383 [Mya arenaria]